ncbi:UNKNOWN [Stylonychia lemnae]|uniref:Uncharacterized protein n=1 Tax=Stylonychia lemnae TaxID=5949 RepID=A0A078ALE4_STYLE|nr:UNKNOWN [Stylonychia lemnae]|eukprot:CDW82696.1 UNKNOWN [Stylonychia lemnae]
MQGGVASVIRLKKQKPSDDVRNLFDRKTYHKEDDDEEKNGSHSPRINSNKNLFASTTADYGKDLYEDDDDYKNAKASKMRIVHDDENVQAAIELRNQKQKHTDFFFKLAELKERIEVYNEVFRSKKPRYLHNESRALKLEEQAKAQRDNLGSRSQTPGGDHKKGKFRSNHKDPKNKKHGQHNAHELRSPSKMETDTQKHTNNHDENENQINEVGEDEEQNSPRVAEIQDINDAIESMSNGGHSRQLNSASVPPIMTKSHNSLPADDSKMKSQLPKIAQTEKRINTQYKQSIEKAIENQKKQDQQTSHRLNAIEKKMPPLMPTQNQKSIKFSTLYHNNPNSQSLTRTNEGGQQQNTFNRLMNKSQSVHQNLILKTQNSAHNLNTLQSIDKSGDQKQQLTKEGKTLLQSNSYADFKSIFKKEGAAKILSSGLPIQSAKNTSKDRSLLMKSIYETNLFKEQFQTLQNHHTTKRGSVNGPFGKQLKETHQKRKKAKSPSPILDQQDNEENTNDLNQDQQQVNQHQAKIKNQSPKMKKLPPVSSQSKLTFNGLALATSQSQPYFLYNQNTQNMIYQAQSNLTSNQNAFGKMKKSKSKKRGQRKSTQLVSSDNLSADKHQTAQGFHDDGEAQPQNEQNLD